MMVLPMTKYILSCNPIMFYIGLENKFSHLIFFNFVLNTSLMGKTTEIREV